MYRLSVYSYLFTLPKTRNPAAVLLVTLSILYSESGFVFAKTKNLTGSAWQWNNTRKDTLF